MAGFTDTLFWPFNGIIRLVGGYFSKGGRMRRNASNWLELADKVWSYRRDVLSDAETSDFTRRRTALRKSLNDGADAATLKLRIEELEEVLGRTGGAVYPKTTLTDNVEFFLVAAIVIFGIRTYFVQPFKIPTNSMWPTYYGITATGAPLNTPPPGLFERAFRLLAFGAQQREVVAPASGEVSALFLPDRQLAGTVRNDRSWLIFPTQVIEYTFFVGGVPATVRVPLDFHGPTDIDTMLIDEIFGSREAFDNQWLAAEQAGRIERTWLRGDDDRGGPGEVLRVPLGRSARAGDPVLRFELLTGDQLFVDRISTHFMRPRVGQGFVFRTDHIPGIGKQDYFIKRLVGVPGDTIEIHPPVLYRNGRPITGAAEFRLNAERVPPYTGYTDDVPMYYALPDGTEQASFLSASGGKMHVPDHRYLAMGDNSSNSEDSRYWGLVPYKDVIGRPLFIYYPFTHRWGPAR